MSTSSIFSPLAPGEDTTFKNGEKKKVFADFEKEVEEALVAETITHHPPLPTATVAVPEKAVHIHVPFLTPPSVPEYASMFPLNVSSFINKEYFPYIEDVLRMITIQIVIQFMYFLQAPSVSSFFNASFFEILFYIVLGVTTYWLIVKKLIFFV
jgi:hypothetical protein